MSEKNPTTGTPSDPLAKARHDLRTPINQILGYAELLIEQCEDDGQDAYRPDLEKIVSAARTQLELVNHYLVPGSIPLDSSKPSLPAAPARQSSDGALVAASPSESLATGGHVLVVDDNEMNRDMLSRRLSKHGYQVSVAADGGSALQLIDSGRTDLVLLDVMMPGISGLEVLERVRKTRSMAELPVIMATARGQSEDIVEALRLGANDYVTKPLDLPVVLARLQTQLALKRQQEQIARLAEDLEKRNHFIRSAFGRYLSDEIVESLLESPEGLRLGGEKRVVTILMSDLRAFTSVSERLDPEQVVRLLNRYLGRMTEIILAHRGTIDEFLGDAILTIFGAPISRPDDALRAVACAAEMQLAMDEVNEENAREGLPRLEMGIGIHTGEVVVGNIGSHKRAKYGVVGPPVNLTGRIETYTVGGQVLVSEATVRAAGRAVIVGESITVRGKGAREPLVAYDLRGVGNPYDFILTGTEEPTRALAKPLAVELYLLEDKRVGEKAIPARLSRVSRTGCELMATTKLAPLSNLKIVLPTSGDGSIAELYGKVTKVLDEAESTVGVRFTAVPPEVAPLLQRLVPAPAIQGGAP